MLEVLLGEASVLLQLPMVVLLVSCCCLRGKTATTIRPLPQVTKQTQKTAHAGQGAPSRLPFYATVNQPVPFQPVVGPQNEEGPSPALQRSPLPKPCRKLPISPPPLQVAKTPLPPILISQLSSRSLNPLPLGVLYSPHLHCCV